MEHQQDTLSAVIFALAALVGGGFFFNRSLAADGFSVPVRAAILLGGAAVIVYGLLYYLGEV
ncbi:hypothetical protein [Neisseria sp.]|uniref:hypothetical protein n=1 Tax=Neisseria sp. TaxID=192066 RepID=UPI0035A180D0